MIRTVFERSWRSDSRWKRRFYARYMTWLERIGYTVVLLLIGGFIVAFNYRVDDIVKAEGVVLEPLAVEVKCPTAGQVVSVLQVDFAIVREGTVLVRIDPGGVEVRAPKTGTVRISEDLAGKTVQHGESLARIVDYETIVVHAKLKGESISGARIGQDATLSRIKIDDESKTLLRGQVGNASFLSRRAFGPELRDELTTKLKGIEVQTRNDIPLTIEEVTEVEVDASMKTAAATQNTELVLDPGPDYKATGRVTGGDHILIAQIADLPKSVEASADATVQKTLDGLKLVHPGGQQALAGSPSKPRYVVKVKAKLLPDKAGVPQEPVLKGTAIERYFDATIQLAEPPQFLVRRLRQADMLKQVITATAEVRTGSKPLAFTLLKRS